MGDWATDDWAIVPFGKSHERSAFTCGQPALDDFIQVRVSEYEKRRLGKTFVAVPTGEKRVLGYYTLAAGAVAFEQLPAEASRRLPRHPTPIILLARLAVDRSVQGQGLGEKLLLDALRRALDLSERLGVHAVAVEALDDAAAAFYRRYGFTPLRDERLRLYLPIATIARALAQ